ncbi:MAG TPA: hypothetical protein VNF68_04640, partial [Candidatus Baltobacteraceae bacterium]|nr:hypothetical protein [Candidatus Baltobacteraceae bacterium]
MIDIGWFDLTVTPISGPATLANGQWTFAATQNPVLFKDDHLYAFFVASYTADSDGGHDH